MSDLQIKSEQAVRIAKLNDEFRRGGQWMVTPSVMMLEDLHGLYKVIKEYEVFTEDNDPYGEHDFGNLSWNGDPIFWKIDYYDSELRGWCDPLSDKCERVMTVYLASEH